jgi:membrane-bound metal-dependent hydrolase YbcI (DUF457 family)
MHDVNNLADEGVFSKYTASFGISLGITSVASALLVIAKEKSPTVMAWMKRTTGHHWTTHSLFALVLFLVLGFGLARTNGGQGPRLTAAGLVKALVGGVAIGVLIIAGFYLVGD